MQTIETERDFTLWDDVCSTRIHFLPAEDKRGDGTVVVFAGGGYVTRAFHEDVGYCRELNRFGLNVFYVDYRVGPASFPLPQLDGRRAVRFVRKNAKRFGIDPDRIAVMGSSAGGHLAASLCTYREPIEGEGVDDTDEIDCSPNAQILCYPAVTLTGDYAIPGFGEHFLGDRYGELAKALSPALVADRKTPPAFIWHTSDDNVVPVGESVRYAERLREVGVPVELHIFPHGAHGLGLAKGDPVVGIWPELLRRWLIQNGWLNR